MLQPGILFRDALTTINRLYWVSRFTAHQAATSVRGKAGLDPRRVHEIAAPRTDEERRHVTLTLDGYEDVLDENLAVLRGTSILQACSAFETALVGYFALCRVYDPAPRPKGYCVLELKPAGLRALATAAFEKARDVLKGEYSKRLSALARRWKLAGLETGAAAKRLDRYYSDRHRIVHGQGIVNTDVIDKCAEEVAAGAVAISESSWKTMLADFHRVIGELDGAVQGQVVKDQGLQLAVVSELAHKPATLGLLHFNLRSRWRLHSDWTLLASYAEQAGYAVERRGRMNAWRIV